MRHIDDDNMDDLFKKSAQDYPLRIGKNDWEKLFSQWQQQSATVVKKSDSSKKKYSLAFVVLLLLSTALTLFVINNNIKKQKPEAAQQHALQETGIAKTNTDVKNLPENIFQPDNNNVRHITGNARKIAVTKASGAVITNGLNLQSRNRTGENFSLKNPNIEDGETILNDANDFAIQEADAFLKRYHSFPLAEVLTNKNATEATGLQIEVAAKKASSNNHNAPVLTKQFSKKGFYIGATAGPEINQVKNQGLHSVTPHLGIIAGYRINGQFSLETGLLYANKKYYSSGKYFNTGKIISTMPAGMELLSLSTDQEFLEIPLKAKWNLLNKARSDFFASAGVTSAVLLKEHNNYNAMVNGIQEKLIGNYHAVSEYFAAFVYISAGYEKQLPNRAALRVEPYLQIPLKGIGQGSMSVLGAGLHFTAMLPLTR